MQTARGAPLNTELDQSSATPPSRRRRIGALAVTAGIVYVLDVVTKVLAVAYLEDEPPIELFGGLLTLTLLRNPGAAFGIAQGYTAVLALVSLIVIVVVIRMARRLASTGWAVALGLMLGGALGNLTDRLARSPGPLRGHVVDFLELPNWPVFNIADAGLTCAAVLIVLLTLLGTSFDGSGRRDGGGEPAADTDGTDKDGTDAATHTGTGMATSTDTDAGSDLETDVDADAETRRHGSRGHGTGADDNAGGRDPA